MKRASFSIAISVLINAPCVTGSAFACNAVAENIDGAARTAVQSPLRVALIGFAHAKNAARNEVSTLDSAFAEALGRDPRVRVIDQSIIQPALAGLRYDRSINMSKDEARRLGAAIGCDFLIVGKAELLSRSERENESHEEAFVGAMIIDARTGALAAFDFVSERASTREAALKGLLRTLESRSSGYVDRIIQVRAAISKPLRQNQDSAVPEIIEDVPEEDSPRAVGFEPPEFLNRVKPEFTGEAEQADITAIVEATVVLRSNGDVGTIEITRWAGFGLDDSAERAIRQLKFKPATRDGKPISVRALIRYNFRRVSEAVTKSEQPAPKPPEKPERDLRQLFKPTYRRP